MTDLVISNGRATDARALAELNSAMAVETEEIHLDFDRLLQGVQAVFADPRKGFYLVAEAGGEVVGQLLITYEWSDWRNGVFWWVQSVYVAPAARGKGVYRALYEEVVRRAREDGEVCGLRLYVERNNDRAKLTYQRLGMSPTVYEMWEEDFVLER